MNAMHASVAPVSTRQPSRHRRHHVHNTRSSRRENIFFLSNHNTTQPYLKITRSAVTTYATPTVFLYDGYTLGDKNCLYLYGPDDIRY